MAAGVYLRGKPIRYRTPKQAIDDGIVYITEDRKLNGFFETMRIDDNIYLSKLATKAGFTFLLSRVTRAASWRTIGSSASRFPPCSGRRKSLNFLAGNEQKVVIAKSLTGVALRLSFLTSPRAAWMWAKSPEIHAEIRRLAEEGKAVVVISSYLPEVLAVSDRILVARLGRIVAEFDRATATEDKIMYAAIH